MTRRAQLPWRMLFIVLVAGAVTGAQFSALALENDGDHLSQHCCALCHVGLPFLQPAVTAHTPPPFSVVWLAPFGDVGMPHQMLLAQASSRAPPLSSNYR